MKNIIVSGLILCSIFMMGCSDSSASNNINDGVETEEQQNDEIKKDTVKEIERGSNEAVDQIYYVVKEKGSATEEELKTAYEWIKENVTNILKGKENMEKAMYYGNLLDRYSKNNEIKKIGVNTVQMTKYVYRGAETALSSDVQNNLKKIKISIDKVEKG